MPANRCVAQVRRDKMMGRHLAWPGKLAKSAAIPKRGGSIATVIPDGLYHHGTSQRRKEGRPRLFRRTRHLDHPEMAADGTRRRSCDLHRRSERKSAGWGKQGAV